MPRPQTAGPVRPAPSHVVGFAMAVAAAAVVAVCAAHAGLDRATILWRAAASLFSVWSFQWSAIEMWKIADGEPLPAAAPHARLVRDQGSRSE